MKKNNKLTKVLPIVISLVSILVAVTSVTWAWVTMNRLVESNDVEMTIEVSPNLVIADSVSGIQGYTTAGWQNSYVVKSWTEDAQELIPVAHYDNSVYPTVTGTNAKNLVYNTNPEQVSRATGKKAASVDLTFAHVPADGNGTYFIDKVVYIASLGKAMAQGADYTNLMFAISESGNGTLTNTAYKSASVDVYVGNTYKGTLNLDTMSSVTVSDLTAIPINTGTPVEITFRCYFDGSLINATDNTKTYVNSAALATNNADITIGIAITATP